MHKKVGRIIQKHMHKQSTQGQVNSRRDLLFQYYWDRFVSTPGLRGFDCTLYIWFRVLSDTEWVRVASTLWISVQERDGGGGIRRDRHTHRKNGSKRKMMSDICCSWTLRIVVWFSLVCAMLTGKTISEDRGKGTILFLCRYALCVTFT